MRPGEHAGLRVEGVEVEVQFVLRLDLAEAPGQGEGQAVGFGQAGGDVELGGASRRGRLAHRVEQGGADAPAPGGVGHHHPQTAPPGHGHVGVDLGTGEADDVPVPRADSAERRRHSGPAGRLVGGVGGHLALEAPGLLRLGLLEQGHPAAVG